MPEMASARRCCALCQLPDHGVVDTATLADRHIASPATSWRSHRHDLGPTRAEFVTTSPELIKPRPSPSKPQPLPDPFTLAWLRGHAGCQPAELPLRRGERPAPAQGPRFGAVTLRRHPLLTVCPRIGTTVDTARSSVEQSTAGCHRTNQAIAGDMLRSDAMARSGRSRLHTP